MNSELTKLRYKIWGLPRSSARLELLERAVALADAHNEIEIGFELRNELMDDACFTGHPDKLLVAFGWCLAQADKHPGKFPEDNLLWKYKWAIANLRDYPQITRAQIETSLADFTARVARNGASPRTIYHKSCEVAYELGDRAKAEELLPLWKKAKRDWLSDCLACELDSQVCMSVFLGDHKLVLKQVAEILKKSLGCSTVPHKSFHKALIPLVRAGDYETAAEYHRRGYAKIKGDLGFVESLAGHLVYLVLVDDAVKAVKLFERHIALIMQAPSPLDRLFFYRASLFLFRRLAASARPKRKILLPADFPLLQDSGLIDTATLHNWFNDEARRLAAQFDSRAGNAYRTGTIDALDDLEPLIAKPPAG